MMSLPPGGQPHWAPTPGYPSQSPLGTAALRAGQLFSTAISRQRSPPPRALWGHWWVEWAEAGAAPSAGSAAGPARRAGQGLCGASGQRTHRPPAHPLHATALGRSFLQGHCAKRTLYPHQAPMRAQCLAHRCWVGIFKGIPRPWDIVRPGLKQACPLPSSSGLATPSHPPSCRSGGSRRDTAERVAGARAPKTSAA